ncbi:MAG: MFS transporter [Polyangiales bacterium]
MTAALPQARPTRATAPLGPRRAEPYRTAPDPEERGWPPGIAFIIGNEGCERFSFYGMRAILKVYLLLLYTQLGLEQAAAQAQSTAVYHLFITGVYATPMLGAIVADRWLGKYSTILALSWVYCAGHAALALFEGNLPGIYLGLGLIALGAGGIKPCVSAHVGDQFGPGNAHKLERAFQAFYFIINFGAFFSQVLIPWTKEAWGWRVAFGIPGILMAVATLLFWAGRHRFVHVPPKPGGRLGAIDALSALLFLLTPTVWLLAWSLPWWQRLLLSAFCLMAALVLFRRRQKLAPDAGLLSVWLFCFVWHWRHSRLRRLFTGHAAAATHATTATDSSDQRASAMQAATAHFGTEATAAVSSVGRILTLFIWVSVFWALWEQHASTWIDQGAQMQRRVQLFGGPAFTVLPEQLQALNPILVMLLIPAATYGLYPAARRIGWSTSAPARMGAGMLITAAAFVVVALLQHRLDQGETLHISWQLLPYSLLTLGEVMVSVTGLEYAYTKAPPRLKSTIMGLWMLTVALGNALTGLLAAFAGLSLASFFWLFAVLLAVATFGFGLSSWKA